MKTYYFEMETEKEQNLFFSLCSLEDQKKIIMEIPMSFHDFLRITCILFHLNFTYYEIYINELFPEYCLMKENMLIRHRDILEEYPDYYQDECFPEKVRNWLLEFCHQIPYEPLQATCRKLFEIDEY